MKVVLVLVAALVCVSAVAAVETAATCGQRISCSSCSMAAACGWCPAASQCVHQNENPCFGMKLGCTDDKLEVELKSADDKPFIVDADVANETAPAVAPKQKWVVFKSKTTNTPDENEFNSTTTNTLPDCADLNQNGICDNQEPKAVVADPCKGVAKCEYVEADVIGDAVAPETRSPSNNSLSDTLSALREAQGSSSSDKVLSKSEIQGAIAKAEEKMEAKAAGQGKVKCEGESCSDIASASVNGSSSGKVLSTSEIKAEIAKAEMKLEAKASGNGTLNAVANAIEAALKEAESAAGSTKVSVKAAIAQAERKMEEKADDQNSSGSKKKGSGARTESSGDEVKDEILQDLQAASNSSAPSNSSDVSAVVDKIQQIKAKEDKKIAKTKAKLNAQAAVLNETIAKEEGLADRIDQLAARISSIEGALAGNQDGKGPAPVGLIAEAVKKVKAYFRKALKDDNTSN